MIKKTFSHIGIFFLNFLSLLPLSLLFFLADLAYYIVYYIFPYRKDIVRKNLSNAFPEKTNQERIAIEKKFFKNLVSMVFEVIKMRSISKSAVNKRVKFVNLDRVEAYFDKGESVLACTGHYGNWELGMLALGLNLSKPEYVIYKPLSNKVYDDWFYHIRTRFGNKFIPMRQTLRTIAGTRNETTMFCFAGDQTPVKEEAHYWINFLNQPTAVLLGLEKIALQTNRPIFYFKSRLIKRGYYEIDCIPLCLDPKSTEGHQITDMQFDLLENIIKEEPAYWLWSHRRWKHKPDHEG
ncbi:lysophospholipid acyltransferase family protein [Pedobacter heparinus]|uniref:lysophospholipid acyltransferase family protein n=1 Tax=Pedobacter heparinus TaxID=984 RepID=UPI00292DC480|nr:lysophospholipid acyltransferase family protein [Pedobacter heparinus]